MIRAHTPLLSLRHSIFAKLLLDLRFKLISLYVSSFVFIFPVKIQQSPRCNQAADVVVMLERHLLNLILFWHEHDGAKHAGDSKGRQATWTWLASVTNPPPQLVYIFVKHPWAISHVYSVTVLLFVPSHAISASTRLTVAPTKNTHCVSVLSWTLTVVGFYLSLTRCRWLTHFIWPKHYTNGFAE